jgi:F-type H+-transporting ATPase subunit alpha
LLKQPQYKPLPIEEQVVAIFAGVRGYLDKFEVGRVGAFESQFVTELKSKDPSIMAAIRADGELKPDTERKLVAFLDNFARSFA